MLISILLLLCIFFRKIMKILFKLLDTNRSSYKLFLWFAIQIILLIEFFQNYSIILDTIIKELSILTEIIEKFFR